MASFAIDGRFIVEAGLGGIVEVGCTAAEIDMVDVDSRAFVS
jgi:hypothetical protein